MKKGVLVTVCLVILCLQKHSLSQQTAGAVNTHVESTQRRVSYAWYNDPDFLSFAGAFGSINQELSRLRKLYAGYIFSATPSSGLTGFEWGYNAGYPTAIIYSNYY